MLKISNFFPALLSLLLLFPSCTNNHREPTPEEKAQVHERERLDSIATELEKTTQLLQQQKSELEKALSEIGN